MIIFNTQKKAQHFVSWCNKTRDFYRDGFEWSRRETYIEKNLVKIRECGDGCGCGCDNYLYDSTKVIGRIKSWDVKSCRGQKLNKLV